jgi:hypothetical protein
MQKYNNLSMTLNLRQNKLDQRKNIFLKMMLILVHCMLSIKSNRVTDQNLG